MPQYTEAQLDKMSTEELESILEDLPSVEAAREAEEELPGRPEAGPLRKFVDTVSLGARGATLGIPTAIEALTRSFARRKEGDKLPFSDIFSEEFEVARAVEDIRHKEALPGAELAGQVLSPIGPKGAKLVSKIPIIKKLGKGAWGYGTAGGIEGTIVGLQEGDFNVLGDPEDPENSGLEVSGGIVGGLVGGTGGLVGKGISTVMSPHVIEKFFGRRAAESMQRLPQLVKSELAKIPGGMAMVGRHMMRVAREVADNPAINVRHVPLYIRKIQKLKKAAGYQIDTIVDQIDKISTPRWVRGAKGKMKISGSIPAVQVDVTSIKNSIRKSNLVKDWLEHPSDEIRRRGLRVMKDVEDILGGFDIMTFKQAVNAKRRFDALIDSEVPYSQLPKLDQARAKARAVLSNQINRFMAKALDEADMSDLASQFSNANIQYRQLSAAEDLIKNIGVSPQNVLGISPIDIAFATTTPTGAQFLVTKLAAKPIIGPLVELGREVSTEFGEIVAKGLHLFESGTTQRIRGAIRRGGIKAFLLLDKKESKDPQYVEARNNIIVRQLQDVAGERPEVEEETRREPAREPVGIQARMPETPMAGAALGGI